MTVADQFSEMRVQGGYRVILADPPWTFSSYSEKGEGKSAQNHYGCMTVADICSLPVEIISAPDCTLFIWVTWPLMPIWNEVITSWGFTFSGLGWEWRKYNPKTGKYAFGPGYGTRKNLEPCLICSRGNPSLKSELPHDLFGVGSVPQGVRSVRDWMEFWPDDEIRSPRREHSRKPDEQYERIETMLDGPYVELFARSAREGWASWGNQTNKFEAAQ